MNGLLLKNSDGLLGLAVIGEGRKLTKATYVIAEKSLRVAFEDGADEQLLTPIDGAFGASLEKGGMLFIGHYATSDLDGEASHEYHIPVTAEAVRKRRAGRLNI